MKYGTLIIFIPIYLTICGFTFSDVNHESEVGAVVTGGNSKLETYNAKMKNSYGPKKNLYTISGHYTLGKSFGAESAKNWDIQAMYGRVVSEKFDSFISYQVEGNRFSGYKERHNSDIGFRYKNLSEENKRRIFELGYRYTVEKTTSGLINNDNKVRIYFENYRRHNPGFYTQLWTELVPNLSDSKDYLFSFEPSLGVVLTSHFSLKFSYKGSYDNMPAISGGKKFDFISSTSLISKF